MFSFGSKSKYYYLSSENPKKLILTGDSLSTKQVELEFLYFKLYKSQNHDCSDYLEITGAQGFSPKNVKYCGNGPTENIIIYPIGDELKFSLVTEYSHRPTYRQAGFLLKYTGNFQNNQVSNYIRCFMGIMA